MKRPIVGRNLTENQVPLPEGFGQCIGTTGKNIIITKKDPQEIYNGMIEFFISRDESLRDSYIAFLGEFISPSQYQIELKRSRR
jgi:hypothetical protein